MSAAAPAVPQAVYKLWWIGLMVTLVVFVPLAVYLLHRTWRAARSIQRYAAEALQAAGGIARNTATIAALDATIEVAGGMLTAAGAVERKLDTVATVLEERCQ
jgi:ABC-type Fe3+ transport system permease subunit